MSKYSLAKIIYAIRVVFKNEAKKLIDELLRAIFK